MEYNFTDIELKWQKYWADNKTYKVDIDPSKPKYYVLDMFLYPSGAGLHVGHPLGFIATDIYARYKRAKGFNVLHPMGYDAFGLPAEQYAIETGQHPAHTTKQNIKRYREQLDKMGFCFDWSREVQTCDPNYYKWTQWIFCQLFNSWYNIDSAKAESIESLIEKFQKSGNSNINAATDQQELFDADQWNNYSEQEKQTVLLNYRLVYQKDAEVNWCPALGTVLANDEVKEGFSERGGHPVVKKKMKQWFMRITAYAERLLTGLDTLDWSNSMKEMQRNWIGRSEGAEIQFVIDNSQLSLNIFTTRPDTIFGATYMVLAPEHDYVQQITTDENKHDVEKYLEYVKSRSERERQAEVDKVTGVFTGAYAVNPLNDQKMPIWISEYVLAGYGTGAIMAVPGHDSRDHKFANQFDLPIIQVIEGADITSESYDDKTGKMINSDIINGMEVQDAIQAVIKKVEELEIGKGQINFRLRDAAFSRQRYWGEPFPVYYKDDTPYLLDETKLPLELPKIDSYKPTEDGEPPLARAENWKSDDGHALETDTMPGYAGSCWYFLRYMDPNNENEFVSKEAENYWNQVDLYIGGAEHATGHLLYSRFWNQFLFDLGLVSNKEPFQKLVNQGMIQGRSNFVYRVKDSNKFVSHGLKKEHNTTAIHVDVNMVDNDILNIEKFKTWKSEFNDAEFILDDGKYVCGVEVEKMSKSKWNVVSPDDIIDKYGADTLRMYEMFLGPLEDSKPWNTHGIEGVHKFLRRLWRLFYDEQRTLLITDDAPNEDELKTLHKTIKKIEDDNEKLSFNTSISAFMICVNELTDLKCYKKPILSDLITCLSLFAPYISEELWQVLGNNESITKAKFPEWNNDFIKEDSFECPVSVNGKVRAKINIPIDLTQEQVQERVMDLETVQKWMEGKELKKFIYVPKRIVNIVTNV